MKRLFFIAIAFTAQLITVGCARAISPGREAYILAHDHGWVELSVVDSNIPASLPPKDKDERKTWKPGAPESCTISAKLNREEFLRDQVYPVGENAPYHVDTGFRFPAPVGEQVLEVTYSGCDVRDGEPTVIHLNSAITIRDNLVVPILFDGDLLSAAAPEQNHLVTLDDIDARLRHIEGAVERK